MSERQPGPYDSIARKWLALVERRQQHCLDLCDTGRWRHYYSSEAEFIAEMQKVLRLREQWAALTAFQVRVDSPLSNGRDASPNEQMTLPDAAGPELVWLGKAAEPAPLARPGRVREAALALVSTPWPR